MRHFLILLRIHEKGEGYKRLSRRGGGVGEYAKI